MKFHSWQAIALGIVSIVGHIVLGMIPIIGWLLLPFFSLAILILAIVCMIKAFQNAWFKLPGIGPFAEKQANQ